MTATMVPTRVDERRGHDATWTRLTTALLLAVGLVLSVIAFTVVMTTPHQIWHPARDAELRATYDAYRETGVPLVKLTGTGSGAIPVVGTEEYDPAAWDDDPGVYLVASLMSHVTGSDSPYPGLKAVMAVLCAAPLLVLPLAVARLVRRARAGYALLLLPVVTWLANSRTWLVGTEYGLSDAASIVPVYAIYGIAAALVFASLTFLLLLTTARLGMRGLVVATVVVGLLAGVSNFMRTMSGVGIALAVGVLWWLTFRGRGRWAWAVGATALALALSFLVPAVTMRAVDDQRSQLTGIPAANLPTGHTLWHSAYLGLSYPTPMNGEPSEFPVVWSDAFGWEQAMAVRPDIVVASTEYDDVMKDIYLDQVRSMPVAAARLYAEKTLDTGKEFAGMLAIAAVGIGLALRRAGQHRRRVAGAVALTLPVIVIGLVPPVWVMPMLYYVSELSAAIGLLMAIGLGMLVWVVTSAASWARGAHRATVAARLDQLDPAAAPGSVSVVLTTLDAEAFVSDTVERLSGALGADDELIVVDRGSADGTDGVLNDAQAAWTAPCRLVVVHVSLDEGAALRAGVLASTRDRVLVSTAHDLPELDAFRALPSETVVATSVREGEGRWASVWASVRGSLLHTGSAPPRSIWADGAWLRTFAALSREPGPLWTSEVVAAAEAQGIRIEEVPVLPADGRAPERTPSSFRAVLRALPGLVRLALQKDDYGTDAPRATRPAREPAPL